MEDTAYKLTIYIEERGFGAGGARRQWRSHEPEEKGIKMPETPAPHMKELHSIIA